MYNLMLAFFLYSLLFIGLSTLALLFYLDCLSAHTFLVASIIYMAALAFIVPLKAEAYNFKFKNGLEVKAANFNEAAKKCYQISTAGKYPGEEVGLDIIDMCVNPKAPKGYTWEKVK